MPRRANGLLLPAGHVISLRRFFLVKQTKVKRIQGGPAALVSQYLLYVNIASGSPQ
jgi:hypothetical protein